MKITLVIASLSSGGAERVLAGMANHWVSMGHDITVITYSAPESDFNRLDERVTRFALDCLSSSSNLFQALYHNLRRLVKLRNAIRKAQSPLVISFMDRMNVMVIIACLGLKSKVIVSEHTDPALQSIGVIWSSLRWITYPFSDAIVVLSEQSREWFIRSMGRKKNLFSGAAQKIFAMPNPIDCSLILRQSHEQLPGEMLAVLKAKKTVFTQIARLSEEKNPLLLVKACLLLRRKYTEFVVLFIGQGPLMEAMRKRISENHLEEHILLLGEKANPYPYLAAARAALLTSNVEGFGLVLAEAMVCGAVPVSTDCSGPRSILEDGQFGLLVPLNDPALFAEAMYRIAADNNLHRELRKGAAEYVRQFDMPVVMKQWEALIQKIQINSGKVTDSST